MNTKKAISIVLIVCMLSILFVQPVLAGEQGYMGGKSENEITIADDSSHEEDGTQPSHEGGVNPGKGQGGKGGSGGGKGGHEDSINTGDDSGDGEEGSKGKGGDNKGGVNKGGGDKGKGGGDKGKGGKGGKNVPTNPGQITLTVEVEGLASDITSVDITLKYEDTKVVETAVRINEDTLVAKFVTEASGDCELKGEDVPGYLTPYKELSLTGDNKSVTETLEYESGTFPVTGVALNKTDLKLVKGYLEQLTATVDPLNANNQAVAWSTSNSNVATVSENGVVKAVGVGTCNITVTTDDGAKTAHCSITVIEIISLENPVPKEALKNELVVFPEKVTAHMSDSTTREFDATWEDNSGNIVTTFQVPINSIPGQVYYFEGYVEGAVNPATFTIIVQNGIATPVVSITLNTATVSLEVDETFQLVATFIPDEPTNPAIKWTSSDNDVAIVDGNGLVKAVSIGSAVITAKTVDGGHEAYCMVSVSAVPEIEYIFATAENGVIVDHFSTREEIFINVENLVTERVTQNTLYYVKVEQKGASPLLGSGTIELTPLTKEFNLYDATNFKLTESYNNEYFVSMSADSRYPKNDELTLKTNFKIGTAVPTVPEENVTVTVDVIGGNLTNPEGLILLLCREIDKEVSDITWEDYCTLPNIPSNPYAPGVSLTFTDEVKMKGKANAEGLVIWEKPKETLKLGGYLLLEVTPKGYVDNLNMVDPNSDDGTLLKEVHLVRDGEIQRNVTNIYVGTDKPNDDNADSVQSVVEASVETLKIAASASTLAVSSTEEQFVSAVEQSKHWAKQSILELVRKNKFPKGSKDKAKNLDDAVSVEEITEVLRSEGVATASSPISEMLNGLSTMTRQQLAALMMLAFNFGKSDDAEPDFKDSNEIDESLKAYASKAGELGIIKGFPDKTFKPIKIVTKAEFYTILDRCLKIRGQ